MIGQGRGVELLKEFPDDPSVFTELSWLCNNKKHIEQLKKILDVERSNPDADLRILDALEIDVCWWRGDYEGVLRRLDAKSGRLDEPRLQSKQPIRIRSLVRLGRPAEALDAAKAEGGASPLMTILAHAANGDVDRVLELAQTNLRDAGPAESWYRDVDLGPLLRSDRFERFRERFPEKTPAKTGGD